MRPVTTWWAPVLQTALGGVIGAGGLWLAALFNRRAAREDRSWHERKTIYIEMLEDLQRDEDLADVPDEGREAAEAADPSTWSRDKVARLYAVGSRPVLHRWEAGPGTVPVSHWEEMRDLVASELQGEMARYHRERGQSRLMPFRIGRRQ